MRMCKRCGKEIPWDKIGNKYCSKECYGSNPPVSLICKQCGKEFKASSTRVKKGTVQFCSKRCYGLSKRVKKVTKHCVHCGKEFKVNPSQQSKKFCSLECYNQSRRGTSVVCLYCGKGIILTKHQAKKRKYCSMRCMGLARRKAVNRQCKYCNQEFQVCPSRVQEGGGHFCSKECFNASLKEKAYVTKNCEWCGQEFEYRRSSRETEQRFCSRKCARAKQSHDAREAKRATCEHCGKEFYAKTKGQKLCSRKCGAAWSKVHFTKEREIRQCKRCGEEFQVPSTHLNTPFCDKHRGKAGRRITVQCEVCGKKVKLIPSQAKNRRFCSQDCADVFINSKKWIQECVPRNAKAMKQLAQKKLEGGMTDIEEICYAAFEALGFTHNEDFFFEHPFGPYALDFYFPAYALCVEANGIFWHGSEEAQRKDALRRRHLEQRGLTVIEWAGPDIRQNVMKLIKRDFLPIVDPQLEMPPGSIHPLRVGRKLTHAIQLSLT